MSNPNELTRIITRVIEEYTKMSITTANDQLIISDRTGTKIIPIGSSQTGTPQTSTFR